MEILKILPKFRLKHKLSQLQSINKWFSTEFPFLSGQLADNSKFRFEVVFQNKLHYILVQNLSTFNIVNANNFVYGTNQEIAALSAQGGSTFVQALFTSYNARQTANNVVTVQTLNDVAKTITTDNGVTTIAGTSLPNTLILTSPTTTYNYNIIILAETNIQKNGYLIDKHFIPCNFFNPLTLNDIEFAVTNQHRQLFDNVDYTQYIRLPQFYISPQTQTSEVLIYYELIET